MYVMNRNCVLELFSIFLKSKLKSYGCNISSDHYLLVLKWSSNSKYRRGKATKSFWICC